MMNERDLGRYLKAMEPERGARCNLQNAILDCIRECEELTGSAPYGDLFLSGEGPEYLLYLFFADDLCVRVEGVAQQNREYRLMVIDGRPARCILRPNRFSFDGEGASGDSQLIVRAEWPDKDIDLELSAKEGHCDRLLSIARKYFLKQDSTGSEG